MTDCLSETTEVRAVNLVDGISVFVKKDVYHIVQKDRAKYQINGHFIYEGMAKGNNRIHFMFKNIRGGWMVSFTEIDLLTGETAFLSSKQTHRKAA